MSGACARLWNGSSSLSAFLSSDRIITGKLVHTGDSTAIMFEIEQALATP